MCLKNEIYALRPPTSASRKLWPSGTLFQSSFRRPLIRARRLWELSVPRIPATRRGGADCAAHPWESIRRRVWENHPFFFSSSFGKGASGPLPLAVLFPFLLRVSRVEASPGNHPIGSYIHRLLVNTLSLFLDN